MFGKKQTTETQTIMKRICILFSLLLLTSLYGMAQRNLPVLWKGLQGAKSIVNTTSRSILWRHVGSGVTYNKISEYYGWQNGSQYYYHQHNSHDIPKIHFVTKDEDRSFGDLMSSVIDCSDNIDFLFVRDSLLSNFQESSIKSQNHDHNSTMKTSYIQYYNNYPNKTKTLYFLQNSTNLIFKPSNFKLYENQ